MNKKKSILCTVLFAIVLVAMYLGMFFVDYNADNAVKVWMIVVSIVSADWIAHHIFKFYDWLMK